MDSYPIVEVVWLDAEEHGEVGWNDTAKMLEYAKSVSYTHLTLPTILLV